MANLPWLEEANYGTRYPQYGSGGSVGGNSIYDYLMSMQPTGQQSIASALPFLNLTNKQQGYYAPAQQAIKASMDVDNPLYKKIYGQQQDMGQRNLAEVLAEAQRQNRKAASLGRVPLFSAERGGEETFRNLTRGYQDVQDNAAQSTRGILTGAAQNYTNMADRQSQFAANNAGVQGNIFGALTKLFRF